MFLTEEMYVHLKGLLLENNELEDFLKADIILLHHSLGRYIRNEFNLWKIWNDDDTPEYAKQTHPDDISHYIMLELQNRLLKEKLYGVNINTTLGEKNGSL